MKKEWQNPHQQQLKEYKRFLQKADTKKILQRIEKYHEEAYEKFDCLACGNCCRHYSPRFKTPDIKRIARHLKLKEGVFIDSYLRLDEDGDYVTKSSPCPFLQSNNQCSIYDERPSDCRRFPYTDEDVFVKRPAITLKNVTFCPIANHVLEKLSSSL